jgi:hypothetical protein
MNRRNPVSIAEKRPQLLEAILGIPFVLSLVVGAMLWDEVSFAGEPMTQGSRIGLAISVGACALLLAIAPRKWPLLLCALFFASTRIPNVWLGSAFPESLRFLVDCFAVSISLFAVYFSGEIVKAISHARQSGSVRRSGTQAGPAAGSPRESHALATLNHARAASPAICTAEPLPSSPA